MWIASRHQRSAPFAPGCLAHLGHHRGLCEPSVTHKAHCPATCADVVARETVDENKVFKAGGVLLLSTGGGRSFTPVSNAAHGDDRRQTA